MKIACISDTHMKINKIAFPDADVLVHAGDLTFMGEFHAIANELTKLAKLKSKYKDIILICGNHDWLGEREPHLMEQLCKEKGITYLNDSGVHLTPFTGYDKSAYFWGSPVQPAFCNWAFNRYKDEIEKHWDAIPSDTDVLITHGPPHKILDTCPDGYQAGCPLLLDRIKQVKPKLHIFGHIHGGYGILEQDGVKYINASICDENYRPLNAPIVVEI